jgi:hypothetical protein
MPNTLTTDQLLQADALLKGGNKETLDEFYNYMYQQGYGYAGLALGLVDSSTFSGVTAKNFLINSAAQQGLWFGPSQRYIVKPCRKYLLTGKNTSTRMRQALRDRDMPW